MSMVAGVFGKTAAFRCDAGPHIGTGHVIRCLALAEALKKCGYMACFLSDPTTLDMMPALKDSGFKVHNPTFHPDTPWDFLIVDHYDLDETYERQQRLFATKILVLDDLADRRHDCDILIDQTYGRNESDYRPIVPEKCRILTGTDYAILRPDFSKVRPQAQERRKDVTDVRRVLVFISGSDKDNVTQKVLQGLQNVTGLSRIDVIIGAQSTHRRSIEEAIKNLPATATIHTNLNGQDLARLMVESDLAIGAGGTTSWERCCLGLPALLIEIADNQKKIATELHSAGAVINLGWFESLAPQKIAEALQTLQKNPEKLRRMAEAGFEICDGLGADRICRSLEKP